MYALIPRNTSLSFDDDYRNLRRIYGIEVVIEEIYNGSGIVAWRITK